MITKELFGKKPCGCEVYAYTVENKNGASIRVLSMGGILQQINMPDRDGKLAQVGMAQKLAGGVKAVAVAVQNDAVHRVHLVSRTV